MKQTSHYIGDRVQVTEVQRSPSLSEETEAFTAAVIIDGARVGTVSNNGCGGQNLYRPHTLRTQLAEIAATLPPRKYHGIEYQPDADIVIGDALFYFDAMQVAQRRVKRY